MGKVYLRAKLAGHCGHGAEIRIPRSTSDVPLPRRRLVNDDVFGANVGEPPESVRGAFSGRAGCSKGGPTRCAKR